MRRSFMLARKVYRHGLLADDWMINYKVFEGLCETGYKYEFVNKPLFYHRLHSRNTSKDILIHYNRIKEVLVHFDRPRGASLC